MIKLRFWFFIASLILIFMGASLKLDGHAIHSFSFTAGIIHMGLFIWLSIARVRGHKY